MSTKAMHDLAMSMRLLVNDQLMYSLGQSYGIECCRALSILFEHLSDHSHLCLRTQNKDMIIEVPGWQLRLL